MHRLPRRARLLLASSTACLALPAASPALADEVVAAADDVAVELPVADEISGDVITVTARRREESAQEVPVALSVIGGETLQRTNSYTLTQIQQLVPSLQVSASNPRNSNINIRGLGANSAIAVDGLEYGVGFYVDGVYYGRPGQSQFDLIDLQRVEVLRGPQGTLFGKNTTAGALNIATKLPSFYPEATLEGSLGNYGFHQVRGSISLPIVADRVAVRLSVADTHRDGFLRNAFDGTDAQDYDNFTVRGQLLVKPTDAITVRVIGDYSKQQQHFMLSLVDGYFTTFATGQPIANSIFDRAARLGYTLPPPNAFLRVGNADAPFQANMESYGVSGQIDWDLGPATLTSITAHRWWDWFPKNDVDGTSLSINTLGQLENFQRQFSQELRIASNGRNTIDYVAGLFYFHQVIRGYGKTGYGADFAEWNLNPATVAPATIALTDLALTDFVAESYSDPRTRSYAAFGQLDWHITDALTLTAGLRYTHEDKQGSFTRWQVPNSGLDLSGLTPVQRAAVQAIRDSAANQVSNLTLAATTSDDAVSGLVTLSYQVTPDVLVYGTYSRGSKSGGLNVTAGGLGREVVRPEKVDNFEIGLKTQFLDRRLTFNAAAFRTEISDYQTTVSEAIIGTTATVQYLANIPKVRSQGIEADLNFAATDRLNLTASLAYTDAKFVSFANSPQRPELAIPGTLQLQDLSGQRLPGVSKLAFSLGVDGSQPLGVGAELYGRADYMYRSSFNATPTNSIYGQVPGYGILNARLGLRIAGGKYDLSVWARNLLDEDYYLNRNGGTFGLITAAVGDPRTFGGTVRVTF